MRILTVIGWLLLIPAPGAFAQSYETWDAACDGEYCAYRKTLMSQTDSTPFAQTELLINTETGTASFVVTTPLGIAINFGVRIKSEDLEWTAPIRVCTAEGCRASVTISALEFSRLLQGKSLEVQIARFGKETPDSGEVPLSGLLSAISKGAQ